MKIPVCHCEFKVEYRIQELKCVNLPSSIDIVYTLCDILYSLNNISLTVNDSSWGAQWYVSNLSQLLEQ